MFFQGLDQDLHMEIMERALNDNPPTPQHTKLSCSRLLQLLHCSHQATAAVDVSFGDVASLFTEQERTITIVNDTDEIFAFDLEHIDLQGEEDKVVSNFHISLSGYPMNMTLFPGEIEDVQVTFNCKQLNCHQFDYFQLWFHLLENISKEYFEEDYPEENNLKTFDRVPKNSVIKNSDKTRMEGESSEANPDKSPDSNMVSRNHAKSKSTRVSYKSKSNEIRKLKEIKMNFIAKQVCEISHKINKNIKKSIKLNLSGACMSPKVSASKYIIKIQGSQKKSFKIFNDSTTKSAYIQIGIDTSNCPIRFSRLCAVIKPKSSISIDVSLKLNLFVSEYFHKVVYISVLNHAPLKINILSCFHLNYNIEAIDSMDHFFEFLKAAEKINNPDENDCSEDEILDMFHILKNTDSEETELHIHPSDFTIGKNSEFVFDSFFGLNTEKYLTIQPNYLHLNRIQYRRHFIVKNKLNVKLFIIWNKESSNKVILDPCSSIINENDSAVFNVEFVHDEKDVFLGIELDCTVYYGHNMGEIILNQEKYEKRARRLEYFLPYSLSVKLCAHSFSNCYSWIPKYTINQEQFTFQFLLNNNERTSMAYSSILIKNCGNSPLHYSINKMKSKFYSFETNPNCNYIQNNTEDHENFHIIYAYLHLHQELPVSYLKRNFTLCLNGDDMYNEERTFEIYSSDSLELTVPHSLMLERDFKLESCEPVQEEQEMSIEIQTTPKSAIKSFHSIKHDITFPTSPGIDFEIPNADSLIEKPECWDDNVSEYVVVNFPPMHPKNCTSVNLPLYNSSPNIIFYEIEVVRDMNFFFLSSDDKEAFIIAKPSSYALPHQLVEIKCSFHPTECREYHQVLRCTQNCLLDDVQIADMHFLLKGSCMKSVILCHPTHINWGLVQSQFSIKGTFELKNIQTCALNYLLRCTIESESDTSHEISNCYSETSSAIMNSKKIRVENHVMRKCAKVPNNMAISKCSLTNTVYYEEMVRQLENMGEAKSINYSRRKHANVIHNHDCKIRDHPQCDSGNDDLSYEMCKLIYVDGMEFSSTYKRLHDDLLRDFIILNPSIDVLNAHETKIIHFSYHPFTAGKHRLEIKLFIVENNLEDDLSELRYNENNPLHLLSVQYTCMESHLRIVDVNITNHGRSKCFSSCDYFVDLLNIPELNKKLECKKSLRVHHAFNLPCFETDKELSFDLVLRNVNNSRHLRMVHLDEGICNGCSAKNLLENKNERVCKHFFQHIHITPKEMEFGEEDVWKFSINYGGGMFIRYIQENTRASVVEYRTAFCFHVGNDSHSMCIVKKYLYLIIRLCPMVPGHTPSDSFLLPMGVAKLTPIETVQHTTRANTDFSKVKYYRYDLSYSADRIQPFWLYNNTSQELHIYVKIVPEYRKIVQLLMEAITMERNSNYPIIFLFNRNDKMLNNFYFEMTDDITRTIKNIEITLHTNREILQNEYPALKDISLFSPSILSSNPLIIDSIPLHHTTKRKLTLKNIYEEMVVFNWDLILIHGVVQLEVKPKFGTLKPLQCKQLDLIVQSFSHPATLNLVLGVELYKEKYYVKYFDTLKELVLAENRRSDIYTTGSGDRATYKTINIEEYRIHAQPKPNIQTIGVEISTYNVFDLLLDNDTSIDTLVSTKINSKLSEQVKKKYQPSSDLKFNKGLLGKLKNIFDEIFWHALGKINFENIMSMKYENMKNNKPPCENIHAKFSIEDIFDVIFEKFLYKNVCGERIMEDVKSDTFDELEAFEDSRDFDDTSENKMISYASLKNLVIRAMEVELAKQNGRQTERASVLLSSYQDVEDNTGTSIDIDEDSSDNLMPRQHGTEKKNSIGMENEYFHDIITGEYVSW